MVSSSASKKALALGVVGSVTASTSWALQHRPRPHAAQIVEARQTAPSYPLELRERGGSRCGLRRRCKVHPRHGCARQHLVPPDTAPHQLDRIRVELESACSRTLARHTGYCICTRQDDAACRRHLKSGLEDAWAEHHLFAESHSGLAVIGSSSMRLCVEVGKLSHLAQLGILLNEIISARTHFFR